MFYEEKLHPSMFLVPLAGLKQSYKNWRNLFAKTANACSRNEAALKAVLVRSCLQFNVAFCWSDSDERESVSPFSRVNTADRSVNPSLTAPLLLSVRRRASAAAHNKQ